jgi:hypothetical protein
MLTRVYLDGLNIQETYKKYSGIDVSISTTYIPLLNLEDILNAVQDCAPSSCFQSPRRHHVCLTLTYRQA